MRLFLGVDTGATKTHAMLADEHGRVLAVAAGGCGNHEMVGYDGLASVLHSTVGAALAQASARIEDVAGAGFGIAGYDWPAERQPTLETIATLGLACPLDAVNDTIVGLVAGTSQGWGLVVDAGTGNNVRGRDTSGREVQVTGCGDLFGEFGGAMDVVRRAVQVVSYAWYGRGQPTALTQAFIHLTGAANAFDLMEGLSLGRYEIPSGAAPLVFAQAAAGDPAAQDAIAWVAREHAQTTCGVIRQLGFESLDFEIVLIGSTFRGGKWYLDPFKQVIWQIAPHARFVLLSAPPVTGGVLLGMQAAGLDTRRVRPVLVANAGDAVRENPS